MPFTTDGITNVRVGRAALDLSGGRPVAAPGALEVAWDSAQAGRWHQVYASGRLAGVTASAEDRRLAVPAPVDRDGSLGLVFIEVVAVDAADRWTDFADQLDGFAAGAGGRIRLTWQAGAYLDPDLEAFDIFGDGRSGSVDYAAPLNEAPIAARPGGRTPWGYGTGGFGVGAWGASAAEYEWTTGVLEPGTWRLAVVGSDAAGNRLAAGAEVEVQVAPLARPPGNFGVAAYDPGDGATLAWDASPDV